MAYKKSKTPLKQASIAEVISAAIQESGFLPTDAHRKAKSAFWIAYEEQGVSEVSPEVSLSTALRFANDSRIATWWEDPAFRSWFLNRHEHRQRMEHLVNLALDRLETVLVDSQTPAATVVATAKLVFEVARKMPSTKEPIKVLDDDINKMTRQELESFLQARAKYIQALPSPDSLLTEDKDPATIENREELPSTN